MSTLSELYITMGNLRKLNLPIDERLQQESSASLMTNNLRNYKSAGYNMK